MPHLIYLAYGFPPAAKSGSYRMRALANAFAEDGWDVTAVSLADDSWHREMGLDLTMLEGLHPRVRRVAIPVAREDLEPDLRLWSKDRATDPDAWRTAFLERSQGPFPEPVFGLWREAFEQAVAQVHAERPADLLLASPMPYITLAAARHLQSTAGVPYVVDYRDGWCVDVVTGETAFDAGSPRGLLEADALGHASQVWFVNGRIRDFYAARHPGVADRMRVVRNGFDPDLLTEPSQARPAAAPLAFGYLGNMTLAMAQFTALLDGWRLARTTDPALAGATLTFRGHMGAGYASGAGGQAALVAARAGDGVSWGGPVGKADVKHVYAEWDVLVLALIGGHYVTSGKVYEYLATGLPIVSAHAYDHAASEVLDGHPLWARAASTEPEDLAEAFRVGAHLALSATAEQRIAASDHAQQFTRPRLIEPAVAEAIALVASPGPTTPAPSLQAAPSLPAPGIATRRGCTVVLVAATRVVPVALRDTVPALVEAGHRVRLISREDPTAACKGLGLTSRRLTGLVTGPAPRLSPAWIRTQWRRRVTPRLIRGRTVQDKTRRQLRTDDLARSWVREADVLVALDRYAVLSVWHEAQRRPEVQAVLGLTEARHRLLR